MAMEFGKTYGGLDYLNDSLPSYTSGKSSSGSGTAFSAFGPGSLSVGARGTGNSFKDAFSNAVNGAWSDVSGLADRFSPSSSSSSSSGMSDFQKTALLSIAPAGIGALASLVNNASTNDTNYQIAQDNLDYQRAFNELIFQREDNAVWRRSQDLMNAGLSKTLAAGSAAGAGGSANAPENGYNRQTDAMTPQLLAQLGQTAVSNANTLLTMYQTHRANEADLRLKNAQAAHQELINADYAANAKVDSELKNQALNRAKLDYEVVNHDFQFARKTGLMHSSQGVVHDTAKLLLGLDQEQWKKFGGQLSTFGDLLWSTVSGRFPEFKMENLFSPEYAQEQLADPESQMSQFRDELRQLDSTWSYNGQ